MILLSRHQLGFTLVELILVIVLLGIVSAVAIPRFSNTTSFDERVLFDDTLNALRYSQKLAVASGCNIQFSINSNSFNVLHDDSCKSGNFTAGLTVNHPANGETSYTGSQSNISLPATQANTVFDALGRASTDNIISVGTRKISIISATGFSYDSTP